MDVRGESWSPFAGSQLHTEESHQRSCRDHGRTRSISEPFDFLTKPKVLILVYREIQRIYPGFQELGRE